MENILETIGNTPLVKVKEINNSKIYAKLERFNPGGSIKDRPVFEMFKIAEKQGLLKNKTIIEASSGNTGIALAMVGAVKNYPCYNCYECACI